jgi:protoporphyrinogen oxidase
MTVSRVISLLDNPVIIIGAGPTGLGAAWRFQERGFDNWLLIEKDSFAGGLSTSFVDEQGFTWDIGGHVQFSHYEYFDHLMKDLLGDQWLHHERESWIFVKGRFVPYPFQYNLHRLDVEDCWACLSGLIDAQMAFASNGTASNFEEWIRQTFGAGISALFMEPYNRKVWAYPLKYLDTNWMGERVAIPSLKKAIESVVHHQDQVSWGPNNTFQFPLYGGTGQIWRTLADRLPADHFRFGTAVERVDPVRKELYLSDGSQLRYSRLLSTMPLDRLVDIAGLLSKFPEATKLRHSSVHIIGVGLKGLPVEVVERKCWMYFPEPDLPFHRVTVFSNYSPNNVPVPGEMWSLMCEVSTSPYKLIDQSTIIDHVIEGLMRCGFILDHNSVISTWHYFAEYGYPTPSVERIDILKQVLPGLDELDVHSRGRFGAWKYEVSNQDHTCMQGVEFANWLLDGIPELTVNAPHTVNKPGQKVKM